MLLIWQRGLAKQDAVELLSGPHDDPKSEVVGQGRLQGMPGDPIHGKTLEEDEFSVQVCGVLNGDHDLQLPFVEEDVYTMSQAVGFIIRWPASDLRRADGEGAGPAATSAAKAPSEEEVQFMTTRTGNKKFKSPAKATKPKSPTKAQAKRALKSKDDGPNTRKRVGTSSEALEVRSPPTLPMKPSRYVMHCSPDSQFTSALSLCIPIRRSNLFVHGLANVVRVPSIKIVCI